MNPRGMAKSLERKPLNFRDTSEKLREHQCNCKPPIESGRVYLGTPHCVLCGHLIGEKGTRR